MFCFLSPVNAFLHRPTNNRRRNIYCTRVFFSKEGPEVVFTTTSRASAGLLSHISFYSFSFQVLGPLPTVWSQFEHDAITWMVLKGAALVSLPPCKQVIRWDCVRFCSFCGNQAIWLAAHIMQIKTTCKYLTFFYDSPLIYFGPSTLDYSVTTVVLFFPAILSHCQGFDFTPNSVNPGKLRNLKTT